MVCLSNVEIATVRRLTKRCIGPIRLMALGNGFSGPPGEVLTPLVAAEFGAVELNVVVTKSVAAEPTVVLLV